MNLFPAKHAAEFLRALRNFHYEETPDGILFPKQHAVAAGVFEVQRNGGAFDVLPNLVVTEGRVMLTNALRGNSVPSTWYVAPFAANVAVTAGLTAATFASTQTEFTSYAETQRPAWTTVASTDGSLTNAGSVATITINNGGQTAVYGAGLLSASAKSSTNGVLLCAALATKAKTNLDADETLGFRYTWNLTASV